MKCTCFVCEKELDPEWDDVTLFGLDGDFIHTICKSKVDEKMKQLNNMTDKEFENYLRGNI